MYMFWRTGLFWILNDVICKKKQLSYQHFRLLLSFLDIRRRRYTNKIVLQYAVNEATFEVLYNALMVTETQLSLCCVSCR